MLRPRIIPCLLIHQGGLVKTRKFKEPKYVGDPINAVKIFNEKESDELMVLDIDAAVNKVTPELFRRWPTPEAKMPSGPVSSPIRWITYCGARRPSVVGASAL